MELFRLEGLQREQEYQANLKKMKDLQRECETQAQQNEALADDISKTLDQIKAGTNSLLKAKPWHPKSSQSWKLQSDGFIQFLGVSI